MDRAVQKQIAACRKRLRQAADSLEERDDERALDDVARELRGLLAELDGEAGTARAAAPAGPADEGGLAAWLGAQPARKLYAIVGGIVVLVVASGAAVMLRDMSAASRLARYDQTFNQAGALLAAGKNVEAAQAYKDALALLPDDVEKSSGAYNNMGWALQQQGRLDEAIAAYQAALKLKPQFPLASNNLAAAQNLKTRGSAQAPPPGPR